MVGIQGVAGVPEPNKSDRSASARPNVNTESAESSSSAPASDDVTISNQAQAAAKVVQALKLTESQTDIRADRVAAAKLAIERGDYKKPEVVAVVAQRIDKFL